MGGEGKGETRNERGDRMDCSNPLGWALAAARGLRGNHGCTLEQRNQNLKRETESTGNGGRKVSEDAENQGCYWLNR